MKYKCPVKGCSNFLLSSAQPFCNHHWEATSRDQKEAFTRARRISAVAEAQVLKRTIEELSR